MTTQFDLFTQSISRKMKFTLTLMLLSGCLLDFVSAQDPYVRTRFVHRNVLEQDGHFLVATVDAPLYIFAANGESFLTAEYFPFFLLQQDTTATRFPDQISDIRVFPNPVSGTLTIQRQDADDRLMIFLHSEDGKQIQESTFPPGAMLYQTSFSSLPQGTYILTVQDEKAIKGNRYKIVRI